MDTAMLMEVEDMGIAMEAEDMAMLMEAEAMVIVTEVADMDIVTEVRESQRRRRGKSSARNFTLTGMTTRKMRSPTSPPSGSMR